MTINLYIIREEQRFKIKQIHLFANEYLQSCFPKLGSYTAFNNRLNRLPEAFKQIFKEPARLDLQSDSWSHVFGKIAASFININILNFNSNY